MSSKSPDTLPRLGLRLGAWYAALFVIGALVLALLTYLLLANSLEARDRQIVSTTLERYAGAYLRGGLPALDETIVADRSAGRHERLLVRVVGRTAQALFYTLPTDWRGFDLTRLDQLPPPGKTAWTRIPSPDGQAMLEVASVLLADGTLFQVGKSTESRAELLERFRALSALILGIILVAAVAGGALVTRRALRPLHLLAATVANILETGRLSERVPVRAGGDALEETGVLFNRMLGRLETLVEGMRGSLDNVAHDLRTPLARLRGVAEGALAHARGEAELRDALAEVLEETERVAGMLDTLMDISEAETGAMALKRERLDVDELLREVIDLYGDVAEDQGTELRALPAGGLTVEADRQRMRQVLSNLVDNALKYTPASGHVVLRAGPAAARVAIEVADDGPGIAAEDLPRIWDRLYRGDRSRSERGLGLGLSLVRAIVQAHGGTVSVAATPGGGATFRVEIPAAPVERARPT
ncbi:MAG: ATP-binding protein [Acidobacteria bacterium]|jgi:heavy metal sensor kinase|nr:ATP-binding protein [Acidobacteriota bacterium]